MDGNGAQLVKILWIGLDLGQTVDLKRCDRYRTFTKHDIPSVSQKMSLFISLIPQKLKVVFSSAMVQTVRPTLEIYFIHITIIAHVTHLRYWTCSRWLPFRRWQTFTRFITPSMARVHMAAGTDRTARLIAVFSSVRLLESSLQTMDFNGPYAGSPHPAGTIVGQLLANPSAV